MHLVRVSDNMLQDDLMLMIGVTGVFWAIQLSHRPSNPLVRRPKPTPRIKNAPTVGECRTISNVVSAPCYFSRPSRKDLEYEGEQV
ncbi:hypothetical protein ARMGADRAFT_1069055 [Armillaria gallica]|uniref:Uncharacterized protein n=1 Tax=Armillaria gallica TaxID=47427 RepID=A0A2H3CB50_ARMGA|nr:hypothetical protein ARMGADRAFT_1069055 [Armillaria gallica]